MLLSVLENTFCINNSYMYTVERRAESHVLAFVVICAYFNACQCFYVVFSLCVIYCQSTAYVSFCCYVYNMPT